MNDWKNILERAGWTFVQAAAAGLIVIPATDWDLGLAKAAALAGVAAVLSLVKTVAQDKLQG